MVASFFIAFITTMVPRIRPPPPPPTSVTTAVSLASYVFKNDLPGTRQRSTAQPRRWMVIRWGEGFPVRMVVFADSFFLLSVHSVSPLDIMQASNTRTATRMAAFWVSSFSFLSLFWVPASTMDSG